MSTVNTAPVNRAKNIIGLKSGKLTVIERDGKDRHGQAMWKCQCSCGGVISARGSHLRKSLVQSCGCLRSPDLAGETFSKWSVISEAPKAKNQPQRRWHCQCKCGNTSIVSTSALQNKLSKGCKNCSNLKDLTGMTFGHWEVLSHAGQNAHRQSLWEVKCSVCGYEREMLGYSLNKPKPPKCSECEKALKEVESEVEQEA
jgi:hypothetical protein